MCVRVVNRKNIGRGKDAHKPSHMKVKESVLVRGKRKWIYLETLQGSKGLKELQRICRIQKNGEVYNQCT